MLKKLLSLICCFCVLVGCSASSTETKPISSSNKQSDIVDISFCGVGDNLIHKSVYKYESKVNGKYDFAKMYAPTKSLISSYDFAYINQETPTLGSSYSGGLSGYPMFNSPKEVLDGVIANGFDWISTSTNHSADRGFKGIKDWTKQIKEENPELVSTGTYAKKEDASKYTVVQIKGVRIGLLSYTYGLNVAKPKGDNAWIINFLDEKKIKKDVAAISAISDVQIVSTHWGVEYTHKPTDYEKKYAKILADAGVDIIVGTHPHVIQPMTYLKGKDGNKTLCMYSLGNFISGQIEFPTLLGGCGACNIEFNKKTKEVNIKDAKFYPTVTQVDNSSRHVKTYFLKDWTNEMGKKHRVAIQKKKSLTRSYFVNLSKKVVDDKDVKLIYE